MADTLELAEAICSLIRAAPTPTPISLMNHDANGAAEIIGAVVERCHLEGIELAQIKMDPDLALELGLTAGSALPHGSLPTIALEEGLGRQLKFVRANCP